MDHPATNSQPSSPSAPQLLTLPPELRLQIWSSVLTLPSQPVRLTRTPKPSPAPLSHLFLLLVCRRINAEATPIFYRRNHLLLGHSPGTLQSHFCVDLDHDPLLREPGYSLERMYSFSSRVEPGTGCVAPSTSSPLFSFLAGLSALRLASLRALTVELSAANPTHHNPSAAFRLLASRCPNLRAFFLILDGLRPGADCGTVTGIGELMRLRGLEECGVWGMLSREMLRPWVWVVVVVGVWWMEGWEGVESVRWDVRGVWADGLRRAWGRMRASGG